MATTKIIPTPNPSNSSFEENVIKHSEQYQDNTKPGEGFFFDFDTVPEYKKAVINWMTHYYGWKLEYNNTFLRKPSHIAMLT